MTSSDKGEARKGGAVWQRVVVFAVIAVALLVAIGLAVWAAQGNNDALAQPTPSASVTGDLSHFEDDADGYHDDEIVPAVNDAAALEAAEAVTREWFELHTNDRLARDEWLAALEPLVTEGMANLYYEADDPESTRAGEHFAVLGDLVDVTVTAGDVGESAIALVSTTQYTFEVQLIRRDGAAPWRVVSY